MASSKIRWDYKFSNLGPKKQISGTTFYKVSLGSDVKWLSMEGIRMLEKARQAGVKFKTVRKAVTHYTAAGTARKLRIIRTNIQRDLEELLSSGLEGFETEGRQKGIMTMLSYVGLDKLAKEFAGLMEVMTEAQLREFYAKNKLLLQKFFADSDPYKSATSRDEEKDAASGRVRENAYKLRDKMLQILTRDMTVSDINKAVAEKRLSPEIAKIVMTYKRGHLD